MHVKGAREGAPLSCDPGGVLFFFELFHGLLQVVLADILVLHGRLFKDVVDGLVLQQRRLQLLPELRVTTLYHTTLL